MYLNKAKEVLIYMNRLREKMRNTSCKPKMPNTCFNNVKLLNNTFQNALSGKKKLKCSKFPDFCHLGLINEEEKICELWKIHRRKLRTK